MKKPVFYDETGKRWKTFKSIFLLLLLLLTNVVLTYLLNLYGIWHVPSIEKWLISSWFVLKKVFVTYIILTIVIGILRMIVLFGLSYKQSRKRDKNLQIKKIACNTSNRFSPTVSVLIPAFNEEIVIRNTIKAVLENDYPIAEILIIDDGSTDHTAAIAKKLFRHFPTVKLIRKRNGGKATALNLGFQRAVGDIVITIDADSIIEKQTVSNLVRQFENPAIAAVSGNCKIGNKRNQLTIWQHIEYITANNLEKRAYDEFNCIPIVPGANSAWRKTIVQEIGFYGEDTLAEDADLTIRILNAGHKIVYESSAISYVECPETIKQFLKQRFRWSYGILQSLWKNKKTIYQASNKPLKYFAVPSMLFSYLLLLTVPLIDIIFIKALLSGTTSIYLFILFFYLLDFTNSYFAFWLEKENKRPLLVIFIQRLVYRYLIAAITWKAIYMAVKGHLVSWGYLQRSGNNPFK